MSLTLAVPVTVAIARRVDPARPSEMVAWMRAGTALAEAFPGFLGAGWVQSGPGSPEWHMLYRFADAETLHRWEESPQRPGGSVRRRASSSTPGSSGVPGSRAGSTLRLSTRWTRSSRSPAATPPRWKQAVTIWLAFFPLSLSATLLTSRFLDAVPLAARVLLMTLCLTPLMTYLVLPRITRALHWWLHGQPAPWRAL